MRRHPHETTDAVEAACEIAASLPFLTRPPRPFVGRAARLDTCTPCTRKRRPHSDRVGSSVCASSRRGKETRLLFTYDPFSGVEPLPLPGPVFIYADACVRYPEDADFPEVLLSHPLTFNAYGTGRRFHAQM